MKSIINFKSPYFLTKIIWSESKNKEKLKIILVILFSIFTAFIQYLYILFTALTFSLFPQAHQIILKFRNYKFIWFSSSNYNDSYFTIISIWLFISFSYHLSAALSTGLFLELHTILGGLYRKKY